MATEKKLHSFFYHMGQTPSRQDWFPLGSGKWTAGSTSEQKVGAESVGWASPGQRSGWGPRREQKAPSPASTPSQLNSICEILSLEIPCLCLLGEDNNSHTELQANRWDSVHHMTPSGSGAGGSGRSSFTMLLKPCPRGWELVLCPATEQAAVFSSWSSQGWVLFVCFNWNTVDLQGFPGGSMAQMVKNLPVMRETWVCSLGQEDPLEKGMATHSSVLAWRTPWTEEPGGLWSMGLQRVTEQLTNTHSWFTMLC